MAPTPPATVDRIKCALSEGQTSRKIAQTFGVSKSFVNNMRKLRPADTPKSKGGHPTKLSTRDKTYVVTLIKRGLVKSAVEATKKVNENRTNPIALKEGNLKAVKKKKPILNRFHRRQRLKNIKIGRL